MSEHEHEHPNYKKIYFILLGLLVVSVAGPFVGIKWITLITAFGIAVVKANLVVQNFMHLKIERVVMKWLLAASLVLMLLLYFGVAPDVMKHEGTRWVNVSAREAIARGVPGGHAEEGEHGEEAEHEAEGGAPEGGAPAEAAAAAVAAAPEAGFDAAGAYASICATCHGATGAGDGAAGAALDPRPANFTDPAFWESRTDEQVATAILRGGVAVGKSAMMPAWSALYDDAQAAALVEYLKTFQQQP